MTYSLYYKKAIISPAWEILSFCCLSCCAPTHNKNNSDQMLLLWFTYKCTAGWITPR